MSWLDIHDDDLPPVCREFEAWLRAEGFELAIDVCPYDGQEGGFQFTDGHAYDYLGGFLETRTLSDDDVARLIDHALDLGEVTHASRWE